MNMVEGTIAAGTLSVEGEALSGLNVPAHDGKALIGIRPHDLIVAEAAGAGLSASGTVEAVEPLGSETLVHLSLGKAQVIATAPGRVVPTIGSTVSVHAGLGSLYLFDAVSEKALAAHDIVFPSGRGRAQSRRHLLRHGLSRAR